MNQPTGGWQPPADGQQFGQPAQAPAQPQQQQQYAPPPGQQMQQPGYPAQQPPGMQPPGMQQGMPVPGQQMAPGMGMQAPATMNPFAGMTSGDQSGGARHPSLSGVKDGPQYNGSYRLKVLALKYLQTRANKMFYIIEVEILEGNQPERPPGMICSIFIDLGNRDTGFKHLAAFLASVFGYDPAQLPKDSDTAPWTDSTGQSPQWMSVAMASIDPNQPLAGREIGCHVVQIKLRNGSPWGLHTWAPVAALVIAPTPPPLLFANPVGAPQVMAGSPPANAIYAGPPQQQYAPQAPPQQQYAPQAPPQQQYAPQAPPQQQQYAPQAPPQQQYAPQAAPQQQYAPQAAPQQQAGPPAPHTPPGTWGGPPSQ